MTHEAVNPKKICCFFCAHFWQISKCSVLDSEAKKDCRFFHTAGKTQLPKRLIVGKDRTAGKVLAGKSVYSALLWFVGSKGENASPQPFMKKAGYRFPEKVAVGSERQFGSFLEQDSTAVPKFAFRSFCPCGNLVGECLPQTLPCGLRRLKIPQNIFSDFSKTVPLHTLFFSY